MQSNKKSLDIFIYRKAVGMYDSNSVNGGELGPQEYTFAASDYNPPKGSGLLVYSVFVRNITGNFESDRVCIGPETFNATAIGN